LGLGVREKAVGDILGESLVGLSAVLACWASDEGRVRGIGMNIGDRDVTAARAGIEFVAAAI
jgi:hypothetical protein